MTQIHLKPQIRQIQKMSPKQLFNPLLGLSPLELEVLLDKSLQKIRDSRSRNSNDGDSNRKGNYFFSAAFISDCRDTARRVPKEKNLELPLLLIKKEGDNYSVEYNPEIDRMIEQKLSQFNRVNGNNPPASYLFSYQFKVNRKWISKCQVKIGEYLADIQNKYIESRCPLDLEALHQIDLALRIGVAESTMSRLSKNLSIQLPDKDIIFADELIPGARISVIKGTYALSQLQQDSSLYENGRWKISDKDLISVLRERFGIKAARRTVNKYMSLMGFKHFVRVPWGMRERELVREMANSRAYVYKTGRRKGKLNYSKIAEELNREVHHGQNVRYGATVRNKILSFLE